MREFEDIPHSAIRANESAGSRCWPAGGSVVWPEHAVALARLSSALPASPILPGTDHMQMMTRTGLAGVGDEGLPRRCGTKLVFAMRHALPRLVALVAHRP